MRKRTEEEIKKIVEKLGYIFLNEYSDLKRKRKVIIKDIYGYRYDVPLSNIERNHIPYFVSVGNSFSLSNISLWMEENIPDLVLMEENTYLGSTEKLNFYCKKCENHFLASWKHIHRGNRCSVCAGKQVRENKNLLFENPEISKEWNYFYNKSNPEDFLSGSNESVFWLCLKCGYGSNGEWKNIISNRTGKNKNGCPSCSGRVVSDKNRLSNLYPEIIPDWHPTKNGDLTPEDVSYGSSKEVWWTCSNGHEYKTPIYSKVNNVETGGCKLCSMEKQESKVASNLKKYFKENYNTIPEYKILKNPETGMWLPYDIYISYGNNPEINGFYIEVHGGQHYLYNKFFYNSLEEFEYQKHKDRLKRRFARKNGMYIEIDLRKIKTTEKAIEYIEDIMRNTLSD